MEETYSKPNSTHKIDVHLLQQLVTECTGWYLLHSLVHLLHQPVTECTSWYLLHSLVHLLQQLVTECTGWYLLHSLVHLLQQLVTECTGWYWLHSLLHLLQQLVRVYRLVLATQPCTLASTYRLQVYKQGAGYTVLTVQDFTPNWLHTKKKKKKKKLAKYRPVAV